MFSDNTSEHLILEVYDSENNSIAPQRYGLAKTQLANHNQRYGYDLGPNYFQSHREIEPLKIQAFLAANFPRNKYPITIRYRVRGYDDSAGGIVNVSGPTEFVVDLSNFDSHDIESGMDHE